MNYLAALAEMAVRPTKWGEGMVENSSEDRSVVNTTVDEFLDRLGDLANIQAKKRREIFDDFLKII